MICNHYKNEMYMIMKNTIRYLSVRDNNKTEVHMYSGYYYFISLLLSVFAVLEFFANLLLPADFCSASLKSAQFDPRISRSPCL